MSTNSIYQPSMTFFNPYLMPTPPDYSTGFYPAHWAYGTNYYDNKGGYIGSIAIWHNFSPSSEQKRYIYGLGDETRDYSESKCWNADITFQPAQKNENPSKIYRLTNIGNYANAGTIAGLQGWSMVGFDVNFQYITNDSIAMAFDGQYIIYPGNVYLNYSIETDTRIYKPDPTANTTKIYNIIASSVEGFVSENPLNANVATFNYNTLKYEISKTQTYKNLAAAEEAQQKISRVQNISIIIPLNSNLEIDKSTSDFEPKFIGSEAVTINDKQYTKLSFQLSKKQIQSQNWTISGSLSADNKLENLGTVNLSGLNYKAQAQKESRNFMTTDNIAVTSGWTPTKVDKIFQVKLLNHQLTNIFEYPTQNVTFQYSAEVNPIKNVEIIVKNSQGTILPYSTNELFGSDLDSYKPGELYQVDNKNKLWGVGTNIQINKKSIGTFTLATQEWLEKHPDSVMEWQVFDDVRITNPWYDDLLTSYTYQNNYHFNVDAIDDIDNNLIISLTITNIIDTGLSSDNVNTISFTPQSHNYPVTVTGFDNQSNTSDKNDIISVTKQGQPWNFTVNTATTVSGDNGIFKNSIEISKEPTDSDGKQLSRLYSNAGITLYYNSTHQEIDGRYLVMIPHIDEINSDNSLVISFTYTVQTDKN